MRNDGLSNDSLSTLSNDRLDTPGPIVDPDDHVFIVTHSYDSEILVNEEVFTSVRDGLTRSAVIDNEHSCNASYAASLTSKFVLGVLTTRSETMPLSTSM
ncbi:hypothetical protein HO173_011250 [Letharia columbiana]|uniref:Uncharacterized protein n=1 Tax=Letharia columbiana TaxID=112416 RepID=A0A8H6FJV0_9LECA|nr:uncharacterized protein HO173_011250 [Letharia columbiana]KAF6229820.1 hypothetical protein HO173_011250 [Letharia columbiana]